MQQSKMLLITVAFVAGGACLMAVRKERLSLTIDRTQPFGLEFGRGSGWHGLDTIKIDNTGRTILHRMKTERKEDIILLSWETATLQLAPESFAEVLLAVEKNKLLELRKEYHANIHDGTQWVLWLKLGEQEKAIYFNNRFPQQINVFAKQIDAILGRAGLKDAVWQAVPLRESRLHERELWDSIK